MPINLSVTDYKKSQTEHIKAAEKNSSTDAEISDSNAKLLPSKSLTNSGKQQLDSNVHSIASTRVGEITQKNGRIQERPRKSAENVSHYPADSLVLPRTEFNTGVDADGEKTAQKRSCETVISGKPVKRRNLSETIQVPQETSVTETNMEMEALVSDNIKVEIENVDPEATESPLSSIINTANLLPLNTDTSQQESHVTNNMSSKSYDPDDSITVKMECHDGESDDDDNDDNDDTDINNVVRGHSDSNRTETSRSGGTLSSRVSGAEGSNQSENDFSKFSLVCLIYRSIVRYTTFQC